MRRALYGAAAMGCALLLGRLPAQGAASESPPIDVVDLHVDLPYQFGYEGRTFAQGTGQYPARALARAGVRGVLLPLYVPRRVSPEGPRLVDLEVSYARVFGALAESDTYALPGCFAPPGRVRTWLAFEGAAPLAGRPAELASWVLRGVRSVGLVHTRANALASSSGDPRAEPYGLTAAGRELVRAAHRLGVSVDVSHASDRALRDVVALANEDGAPVLATHSNAHARHAHARNIRDADLRAIARTGGVVGVTLHTPFLTAKSPARVADVVEQVRHMVRVMGVDHVALGSDFEGDITPPAELGDVSGLPRLAEALLGAGFSRDAVERVFSRNALRVLCRERAR